MNIKVLLPRWKSLVGIATLAVAPMLVASCASSPGDQDVGQVHQALALQRATTTQRLRVLTFNTWGVGPELSRVAEQARRIHTHADGFDVIVLNEVFGGGLKSLPLAGGEGARDKFYDELKADFPYVIYQANSRGLDLSDSGLMAFSRYPFVMANRDANSLPLNNGYARLLGPGPNQPGDSDRYVRFLVFDQSCNTDQFAAKGVALFHIEPPGGRVDVAISHTNAGPESCAVDARKRQFDIIRTLINDRVRSDIPSQTLVVGDLNVDGWSPERDGSAEHPASSLVEYKDTVWGSLNPLPFFDAWRTTSPRDEGVTNNLGIGELGGVNPLNYVGNHRYDYMLVGGAGYHTAGAQTWTPPSPYTAASGSPRCVNWIRTTLKSSTSDHFGLAAELGPKADGCNPALALPPDDLDGNARPYTLPVAGADRWFHLDPGTYTIGLAEGEVEAGLKVEIFSSRNLSRGTSPLPNRAIPRYTVAPGSCNADIPCVYSTNRYFGGQDDLYVRVYSPDGLTYGRFNLVVRKHDCATEETACELQPGVEYTPDVPTDREFKGFFTHSSMATINPRVPQTLAFVSSVLQGVDGKVQQDVEMNGAYQGSSATSPVSRFEQRESNARNYLVVVSRSANSVRYSVKLTTNITVVSGAKDDLPSGGSEPLQPSGPLKLVCIDEGGANFAGDEEISATLWADGIRVAGPPALFNAELDADEAMDMSSIPTFGFVNEAYLDLVEHKGDLFTDPAEDTAKLILGKLAPETESGKNRQESATLRDVNGTAGPTLQFQYHVSHGRVP